MKPSVQYSLLDTSTKDQALDGLPVHCVCSRCHGEMEIEQDLIFPHCSLFQCSVFLSGSPSASAAAMAVAWWPLQTMVGYIFQPGFRWSGKVTAALQHRRMRFSLIIAHFSSTSFETGKCGPPDIRCLDHQYPWITKFMLQAEF